MYWTNGDRLGFRHVPEDVYRAMITSDSIDDYYEQHIKGQYECLTDWI